METIPIITAIGAFSTLFTFVVAMYFNTRKMSRETTDRMIANATQQTEISRDIQRNTEAISRTADAINNILTQLEKQDGEIRALREADIKIQADLQRIDSRAQQAFNRHDDRKKEYEEAMREIAKLREKMACCPAGHKKE